MKNNDEIESLDYIDNYILSSFDCTNSNENNNLNNLDIIKDRIIPLSTPSSPTLQLGTYSATSSLSSKPSSLINSENENTILLSTSSISNSSLIIDQKSSTPKVSSKLSKELAVLNDLYEQGLLNDATQISSNKTINSNNYLKNHENTSFSVSPIIANNMKPQLSRLANNNDLSSSNNGLLRQTLKNNLFKSQFFELELTADYQQNNENKSMKHSKSFENDKISSLITKCGFTTAGGKKLPFDNSSLKKVKELLDDDDTKTDASISNSLAATVKKEYLSSSAVAFASAQKTIEYETPSTNSITPSDKNHEIITSGFTTAKGNNISLKSSSLENAKKLMEIDKIIEPSNPETAIVSTGFPTAKGKQISLSLNALENAKKLTETDKSGTNAVKALDSSNITSDFSTAKGKKISLSASSLENAQKIIDIDNEINKLKEDSVISIGFTTATGKQLQVSANLLNKEMSKYENMVIDNDCLPSKIINDEENIQKPSSIDTKINISTQIKTSIPTNKAENFNRNSKSFKQPKLINKSILNESTNDNKTKMEDSIVTENLNNSKIGEKSVLNESKGLNTSSFLCHYGIKLNTQERAEIEQSINTLLLNESFNTTQPFNTSIHMEIEYENKIDDLCSFSIKNRVSSTSYLDLVKTIEINTDHRKNKSFKPVLVKPVFKLNKLDNIVSKRFMEEKLGGKLD
jgi:hypothetical protein